MGYSVQVPTRTSGVKGVKGRVLTLSIPYNMFEAKGGYLGLDAHFWTKLNVTYRRILLVRDRSELDVEPKGCMLNVEVKPLDQIRGLLGVREEWSDVEEGGFRIPLSLLRIASFIVPYRFAEIAWGRHVDSILVDEFKLALNLVDAFLSTTPRPLGDVMWLNVRIEGSRVEDRVLSYLSRVDKMFSLSLRNAIEMCSGMKGFV